ncbi:transcriptional regulatory protein CpxR [Legionella steigerwaltii]|uniref:Transcriptional regulatory protein CpxR n=1 Tax=Legionella steigerwaltii TaxID=460 RepID=A0A378LBM7_9GAMM|nr:response regulator [Legionella steigerwaltii]KTD77796.1 transcriptional regulatory protein CpxR [Legionella steigerwaltii]STY24435.1 transcriptional regulatory protein CpxR [Legionella steigerwaltii]
MKKITLLLVEDEEAIRDMLRFSIPESEFDIIEAGNMMGAMNALEHFIPDLIILDWMLPDKSGIDFIRCIRKDETLRNIPIIMLTAKAEEENKVKGLMVGADDYLTKPFSPNELIARVKTILRRGSIKSTSGEIKIDSLIVNTNRCQVTIDTHEVKLTPIEYRILHFFILHPNKTYTRDQLLTHIWGRHSYIEERTIDVQIKRLRGKLKKHEYHDRIKTARGIGYYFSGNNHAKE